MKDNDSMPAKILIVEDEKEMAKGIQFNLTHEGFKATPCCDPLKAIKEIEAGAYSLILLDIMMPNITGLKILETIRKKGILTPIILLTALSQPEDKVLGLELGADDYITKPFGIEELIARIKAVLRRYSPHSKTPTKDVYEFKGLKINLKSFSVKNDTGIYHLSNFEAQILKYLLAHLNQVVTRNQLLEKVWGYTSLPTTRTIDNHIARLRKKIEPTPEKPVYIKTIHGVGYKFSTGGEKL